VARRVDAFDGPAIAFDDVAVLQLDIRHEIHVAVFLDLHVAIRRVLLSRTMRPEGKGLGAGERLQGLGGGGVVAMRMRDEDMAYRLAFECAKKRLHMLVEQRARIDDGDIALADDVGAGALVGEGGRIVRNDAANEWRDPIAGTVLKLDLADVGNLDGQVTPPFCGRLDFPAEDRNGAVSPPFDKPGGCVHRPGRRARGCCASGQAYL